ncbi:endonuclease/exonuclease/phosphatase family protein [Promicromonospora citrea]|uniref:Endonuclease n=1 Tax=Promicromonospora citrea TaxID=43677 RepID=A0A8H9GCQ8_9MICO|nr:endonuclease/exonuclease/phosphatase family protein [Promicromonospora citrea]NNH54466.1 endonuclease/exonuclease/phosphatase family protein [Promicromonospora citrea]GGM09549.1 endonuclease [Promicromonospora citrea]
MRFVRGLVSFVLWLVTIPLLVIAVARALPFDNVPPLPLLVPFTPWAALVALPLLVIALFSRRPALAVVLAVSLAGFVAWTAPFFVPDAETAAAPADPDDAGTVRVMTLNAHAGGADARAVVDLVESEHVEVLAVQELTHDLADQLAAAGLDDLLPHSVTAPAASGPGGTGLWSVSAMTKPGRLDGSSFAMPSAVVDVGGTPVRFTAVHAYPPLPARTATWRTELVELTDRVRRDSAPQILAGDFNATYDHATFRDLLGSRFVDATREWGAGPVVTWPEGRRVPPLLALDHVVVERDMTVSDVVPRQVPGTDHRALLATVVVDADA